LAKGANSYTCFQNYFADASLLLKKSSWHTCIIIWNDVFLIKKSLQNQVNIIILQAVLRAEIFCSLYVSVAVSVSKSFYGRWSHRTKRLHLPSRTLSHAALENMSLSYYEHWPKALNSAFIWNGNIFINNTHTPKPAQRPFLFTCLTSGLCSLGSTPTNVRSLQLWIRQLLRMVSALENYIIQRAKKESLDYRARCERFTLSSDTLWALRSVNTRWWTRIDCYNKITHSRALSRALLNNFPDPYRPLLLCVYTRLSAPFSFWAEACMANIIGSGKICPVEKSHYFCHRQWNSLRWADLLFRLVKTKRLARQICICA
jgi:hypothetical protein